MEEEIEITREQRLIFELIRFKDYDKRKICGLLDNSLDYPWVLGQLLYHRVGGVAYYVLKKCDALGQVNREFRNSLKSSYEMNLLKTQAFKNTLYKLSQIFQSAKFPLAFLKGSYLSTVIYPEGLRTSNDFDVLINQEDTTECGNLLKNNGFIQGYYSHDHGIVPATRRDIVASRMNRGETVPFLKPLQNTGMDVIEVDINFSLDFKAKHERDIVGEMLANTQVFKINDQKLPTLSRSDFVIQLCGHLYKEATTYNWVEMGRDLSLYKFCDIYAYFMEFGNSKFFNILEEKICFYGLEKECYYTFINTLEIYPSILYLSGYKKLLRNIKPEQEDFLKKIYHPGLDRNYIYKNSFIEWLFCFSKESQLTEI